MFFKSASPEQIEAEAETEKQKSFSPETSSIDRDQVSTTVCIVGTTVQLWCEVFLQLSLRF